MYPGHYQAPQQHPQQYGAPPGHPPGAPVFYTPPSQPAYPSHPPAGAYPPPASAYPAYPPQQQYAPPASSPYPPAAGAYPPYGAPPAPHQPPYGAPPAHMTYPSHAPPPYSSPVQGGYAPPGHAPPGHAAPPASMYPIPHNMMVPANVPPPPQGWSMHQHSQMIPPTNFQLSSCQGRKRALFIGINYFRQRNELRGCINDVKNIKAFIIRQFGFKEEDTVSLTDDQQDPTRIPTKANIIAGMQWLVRDARPNDSFFFHFSGHGGQTADTDGDEEDGFDETIYPVDHQKAGVIVDDTLHSIMVRPLPAGCRLTAIMDCCHSGSALDLPYIYSTSGQLKEGGVLNNLGGGLKNAGMSYLRGDIGGVFNSLGGMGKKITNPNARAENIRKKSSPSDCIMFSGCKDTQTSADAHEQGFGMTGAMTFSFISALSANPRQSYIQLLNSIRDILRSKYSQKPQLSSSHPVDLNLIFTM